MPTIAELMDLAEIPMMQDYGDHLRTVKQEDVQQLQHMQHMQQLDLEDIEEEEGERKRLLDCLFPGERRTTHSQLHHLQPMQPLQQLHFSMAPLAGVNSMLAPRPFLPMPFLAPPPSTTMSMCQEMECEKKPVLNCPEIPPPSHLTMDAQTRARMFGKKFIGPQEAHVVNCHRCEAPMRVCVRKLKYADHVKEYPSYRCTRKGCQTFKSMRVVDQPEPRAPPTPKPPSARARRRAATAAKKQARAAAAAAAADAAAAKRAAAEAARAAAMALIAATQQPITVPRAAPPPPPPPPSLLPMANPYAGIVVPRAAPLADADAASARHSPPTTTTLATLLGAPPPLSATHADHASYAPLYSTAARNLLMGGNWMAPTTPGRPSMNAMMAPLGAHSVSYGAHPMSHGAHSAPIEPPKKKVEPRRRWSRYDGCTQQQKDAVAELLRRHDEELLQLQPEGTRARLASRVKIEKRACFSAAAAAAMGVQSAAEWYAKTKEQKRVGAAAAAAAAAAAEEDQQQTVAQWLAKCAKTQAPKRFDAAAAAAAAAEHPAAEFGGAEEQAEGAPPQQPPISTMTPPPPSVKAVFITSSQPALTTTAVAAATPIFSTPPTCCTRSPLSVPPPSTGGLGQSPVKTSLTAIAQCPAQQQAPPPLQQAPPLAAAWQLPPLTSLDVRSFQLPRMQQHVQPMQQMLLQQAAAPYRALTRGEAEALEQISSAARTLAAINAMTRPPPSSSHFGLANPLFSGFGAQQSLLQLQLQFPATVQHPQMQFPTATTVQPQQQQLQHVQPEASPAKIWYVDDSDEDLEEAESMEDSFDDAGLGADGSDDLDDLDDEVVHMDDDDDEVIDLASRDDTQSDGFDQYDEGEYDVEFAMELNQHL